MTLSPNEVYLGIDLGTSSVKVVLIDSGGVERGHAQVHYPVHRPRAGWAEQDPEAWWRATVQAIRTVTHDGRSRVVGVGLSGQMHGLVLVDDSGTPLYPAIIWSDNRSIDQVAQWNERIDSELVERHTGFPTAAGMTGTSLSWVRDNEPEVYARARLLLLPKDYIRFRLTGVRATDPTDAGGTLLYDIRSGTTFGSVFDAVGLRDELMPPVIPSLAVAGTVHREAAVQTGLALGAPVVGGAGDQAMASIALGLDVSSRAAVAISSGGTVFKRTAAPLDASLGLHVLPHAFPNQWLAMGVVLSAGLSIDWMANRMFGGTAAPEHITSLMSAALDVAPGAEGLLFSSQLGGTRTPAADPTVRGNLIGLGYQHGQEHITRAMVEGVCIALSRALDAIGSADGPVEELVISGGAARFAIWRQTLSDVTGLPVSVGTDIEHSAMGAAMGAALAVDPTFSIDVSARLGETVVPNDEAVALYRDVAQQLEATDLAVRDAKAFASQ